MNKLKNSFTLTKRSVKILAIFTLLACGPGMVDVDEFMSFFMPESANSPAQNQKYNYTSNFFYGENEFDGNEDIDTLDLCKNENMAAWQKYCNNKVAGNEIAKGIYGKFGSSTLQKYLTQNKNELAKNYIVLAKEIDTDFEKSINSYEGEENKYVSKADVLEQKTSEFINKAKQNKDVFIEERLAFQLVKFSAVKKNYEEAISRYTNLIEPIKQKSFISDWALMRKAEAETSLGNKAEAYYDFAQVFDRSESHRNQADVVVRARIDSLVIDDSVLKFCKNAHEKAAVYAFAGIKPAMDALPMLEQMVEIEPQNPMIELIMAREINKNEAYYYQQYWEYEGDSVETNKKQQIASDYWSKLKGFSVKCAENQKLPKTGFWQVASAYMEYIEGDLAKSKEFLTQAKSVNSQNKGLKNQILIQELLLTSKKAKEITPEVEMAYLSLLEQIGKPKGFRMSNAVLESCNMLASKYRGVQPVASNETKGGFLSSCSGKKSAESVPVSVPNATAKAYLLTMLTTYQVSSGEEYGGYMSQRDMFPIEDTTSLATVEKLVQYYTEPKKSDFDKRLQKLVGFKNNQLYTLMGRRAMDEHNYAKAAEAFGKVNPMVWKEEVWTTVLNEDPFYISPKFGDKKTNTIYSPYTFAKKMAELEANLKANPNDAESAYLLGCGAFNTTTHGNSWILRRHGWSGSEVNSYDRKNYESDYYQATKSKIYFIEAMKSTNPEIAAKACFGAAQCERVAFDVFMASQDTSTEEDMNKFNERMDKERISKFSTYFQLLKTKYQNTAYQKQVLEECGDYSVFAGE